MQNIKKWNNFSKSLNTISEQESKSKEKKEDDSELSKKARLKIDKAKLYLITGAPFFGQLASHLKFIERRDLPYKTMATNGANLYYDPNFVMKHEFDEIKWVILHEIMHCVLNHFLRSQADQKLWNAAADYALNQRIDPDVIDDRTDKSKGHPFGKMPAMALGGKDDKAEYKGKFIGLGAEQIYQWMLKNNITPPPEEGWNYGAVEPYVPTPKKIKIVKGDGSGGKPNGRKAKLGDYVALPNGGWGKIEGIDATNGDCDITPLTTDELKAAIEKAKNKKVKKII